MIKHLTLGNKFSSSELIVEGGNFYFALRGMFYKSNSIVNQKCILRVVTSGGFCTLGAVQDYRLV